VTLIYPVCGFEVLASAAISKLPSKWFLKMGRRHSPHRYLGQRFVPGKLLRCAMVFVRANRDAEDWRNVAHAFVILRMIGSPQRDNINPRTRASSM